MATTVSTLAYKIIADTSSFTKGVTATRKQMTAARKIIEETQTPLQKHQTAVQGLGSLYKKDLLTTKQYFDSLFKLNEEHKRSTGPIEKQTSGLEKYGKTLMGLAGVGGGLALFRKALSFINSELQAQAELHRSAYEAQQEAAVGQKDLFMMLGMGPKGAGQFAATVKDIAAEAHIPEREAMTAMSNIVSAVGPEAAPLVARTAFKFFAHKPSGAVPFAGAVGDLGQQLKATTQEEYMQVGAFLISAIQKMRLTELGQLEKFTQVTAGVTGGSFKERMQNAIAYASLFGAAGRIGTEATGEMTRTAVSNLRVGLANMLPEEDVVVKAGAGKYRTVKGTGLRTFQERIAAAQRLSVADPEFAAEIAALPLGRSAMKDVLVKAITDPSSKQAKLYKQTLGQVGPDTGLAVNILHAMSGATSEVAIDTFGRRVDKLVEDRMKQRGPYGAIRENMIGVFKAAHRPGDTVLRDAVMSELAVRVAAGDDPFMAADDILQRRISGIKGKTVQTGGRMMTRIRQLPLTEEQKANRALFQNMVEELKLLNSTLGEIASREPGVIEETEIE